MGEVKVQVRLTNALDEMRCKRGEIKAIDIRAYLATAIVDTGAVRCVVPQHVVEKLGIKTERPDQPVTKIRRRK